MILFDYTRPQTVSAAIDAIARHPSARFIAGGTNLVDLMKRGVMTPQKVIDISRLPLRGIEQKKDRIHIGALTLNSTVAEDPIIARKLPLLAMALKAGASPQIRNMATMGGNLLQRTRCPYFYDINTPCNKRSPGSGCSALKGYNRMHAVFGTSEDCIAVHPSDLCVALAAEDAVVIVRGVKGERRIPFAAFHRLAGNTPERDNNLSKDEIITGLEITLSGETETNVHYLKIRDRASYAFALVSVAVVVPLTGGRMKGVRLAMGGVAHKPWRLTATEKMLENQAPSVALFRSAAESLMKDARSFGGNDFKKKLVPNALVQALKTCTHI